MRFWHTIAFRCVLLFGLITAAIVLAAFAGKKHLNRISQLNTGIAYSLDPAVNGLKQLNELVLQAGTYPGEKLHTPEHIRYPSLKTHLRELSVEWEKDRALLLQDLFRQIEDSLLMKDTVPATRINQISGNISFLTGTFQQQTREARRNLQALSDRSGRFLFMVAAVLIALIISAAWYMIRLVTRPLSRYSTIIRDMKNGILPTEKIPEAKNEMGKIAGALNALSERLKQLTHFSAEIGKGHFEQEFNPLSEHDLLGSALMNMRNELRNAAREEAKRKKEDDQRNWAAQGIAVFSDILREEHKDLRDLSHNIIRNLVKYLDARAGGLFIVDDREKDYQYIEMMACFAFDRKKALEKKIPYGEGLLGRSVQEGETIFLTDIPPGYITISSGMGETNPRSILIVPLKLNEVILGAVEIASFHILRPYQIDFVERIAINIASTISSVRSNIRTSLLLKKSQQQTEELASQEEELRQNMEEMRAIQEQSAKSESELRQKLKELQKKKRDAEKP